MSTRSVTTIRSTHGAQLALYRHHDGYPAEAGGAILEALRGATSAETVAARLLALQYTDTPGGPRTIYELTTSAEGHGDLEHTYEVIETWNEERNGVAFTVRHGRRYMREDKWVHALHSVQDFAAIVNSERREINSRMDASEQYRSYERYLLIALEGL
jgi:uncharacterized protein YceH (UPF0502 family)